MGPISVIPIVYGSGRSSRRSSHATKFAEISAVNNHGLACGLADSACCWHWYFLFGDVCRPVAVVCILSGCCSRSHHRRAVYSRRAEKTTAAAEGGRDRAAQSVPFFTPSLCRQQRIALEQ